MYTVYGMKASGNCYKIELLLEQLGLSYRWIEVNSAAGETRNAEFLAMNANGKVPLLQLPTGEFLAESNAMLFYLAEGSDLLPRDRLERARALQWMFFEQYSHEPYIAVARFIAGWLPADHPRQQELPRLRERGYAALEVMEKHLDSREYLVDSAYGVADIALFAYTHTATAGGFDLQRFPNIVAWLQRVRATPRFVAQTVVTQSH
ncbi:MAG: glutathione S-transferase family protein [Pseudomonadota bacterium]|nr:glutathione S-transferase family protein [Pseudomonadota bacterium]